MIRLLALAGFILPPVSGAGVHPSGSVIVWAGTMVHFGCGPHVAIERDEGDIVCIHRRLLEDAANAGIPPLACGWWDLLLHGRHRSTSPDLCGRWRRPGTLEIDP